MITNITLDVMNITYHGRDHDERAVPEYPGYILYFIYHRKISLCANFPGSQIALSRDRHGSIHKTFHDYKYLLICYLSVLYLLTKTGGCWISSSGFHLVSCEIPLRKSQTRFLEYFSAQSFYRYFSTLLILNSKFIIATLT